MLLLVAGTESSRIGQEIGVDPDVILATSHGRRSIDVLQIYEPKLANWECKWPIAHDRIAVTDLHK